MRPRAYRRLEVDERRRRLLDLGLRLFTRHAYDEVTMSAIAREAGISKALLYHYFPSKQAFFQATLAEKAQELADATAPDPGAPPAEQLRASVDAYLGWIEDNADAYGKLMRSAGVLPEIRELVEGVRRATAARILAGLVPEGGPPAPKLRAAVTGWLWFMDGACSEWIAARDLDRAAVLELVLGTLAGALAAAGEAGAAARAGPVAG